MKYLAYLVILLFTSITIVQAQDLTFGLKAGGTAGVLIGPVDFSKDKGAPVFKPHIGLWGNYKLNDKLSLQGEIVYNITGVKYETYVPNSDTIWPIEFQIGDETVVNYIQTYMAGDVSGTFNLHYLEIPLLLVGESGKKWDWRIGGRFAYLLKGSNLGNAILDIGTFAGRAEEFESVEAYQEALFLYQLDQEFDEGHVINNLDIGLVLGTAYELKPALKLAFMANYGLLPVQPKNNILTANYTNLFLQTSLQYQIGK